MEDSTAQTRIAKSARRKAKEAREAADAAAGKPLFERQGRSGGAATELNTLELADYDEWYEKLITQSPLCKGENAQYICKIMHCISRAIRIELIKFFGPLMETVNVVLCAISPGFPYIMETIVTWNDISDLNRNKDHIQRLLTDIIMSNAPPPDISGVSGVQTDYSKVIEIISSKMNEDGQTVERVLETLNPTAIAEKISNDIEETTDAEIYWFDSSHGDSLSRFHVDTVLTVMVLNNCLCEFLQLIETHISEDLYFNIPEGSTVPSHFKYHILKSICRGLVCLPNPLDKSLSADLSDSPDKDAPIGLKWNERFWLKTFIANLKSNSKQAITGFLNNGLNLIKILDRIILYTPPSVRQVLTREQRRAGIREVPPAPVPKQVKTIYGEYLINKLSEYDGFTPEIALGAWKGAIRQDISTPDKYIEWLINLDKDLKPLFTENTFPPTPPLSTMPALEKKLESAASAAAVTPAGPLPHVASAESPVSTSSTANPGAVSAKSAASSEAEAAVAQKPKAVKKGKKAAEAAEAAAPSAPKAAEAEAPSAPKAAEVEAAAATSAAADAAVEAAIAATAPKAAEAEAAAATSAAAAAAVEAAIAATAPTAVEAPTVPTAVATANSVQTSALSNKVATPGEEGAAEAEAGEQMFEDLKGSRKAIEKRRKEKNKGPTTLQISNLNLATAICKANSHCKELCDKDPECKPLLDAKEGGFRRTIKRVYKTRINSNKKKQAFTHKSKKNL